LARRKIQHKWPNGVLAGKGKSLWGMPGGASSLAQFVTLASLPLYRKADCKTTACSASKTMFIACIINIEVVLATLYPGIILVLHHLRRKETGLEEEFQLPSMADPSSWQWRR
jgi:hypothetical protein